MNVAENAPKSMFLGKLSFWLKVVPKTLRYCKTDEKINLKKIYLGGG